MTVLRMRRVPGARMGVLAPVPAPEAGSLAAALDDDEGPGTLGWTRVEVPRRMRAGKVVNMACLRSLPWPVMRVKGGTAPGARLSGCR